jgi:ketol-acid reductoisomerase
LKIHHAVEALSYLQTTKESHLSSRWQALIEKIFFGNFSKKSHRKLAKYRVAEYKGGCKKHSALLKKGANHPIEKVGERLRGLMPWMKKRSIKGAQAAY